MFVASLAAAVPAPSTPEGESLQSASCEEWCTRYPLVSCSLHECGGCKHCDVVSHVDPPVQAPAPKPDPPVQAQAPNVDPPGQAQAPQADVRTQSLQRVEVIPMDSLPLGRPWNMTFTHIAKTGGASIEGWICEHGNLLGGPSGAASNVLIAHGPVENCQGNMLTWSQSQRCSAAKGEESVTGAHCVSSYQKAQAVGGRMTGTCHSACCATPSSARCRRSTCAC